MNYLMSALRVGIGVVAGMTLLLLGPITLSDHGADRLIPGWGTNPLSWQVAAIVGLFAGFAERLVPTILRLSSAQIEPSFGTPAQAARSEERQDSHKTGKQERSRNWDASASGPHAPESGAGP
jgi:hypothetical protein